MELDDSMNIEYLAVIAKSSTFTRQEVKDKRSDERRVAVIKSIDYYTDAIASRQGGDAGGGMKVPPIAQVRLAIVARKKARKKRMPGITTPERNRHISSTTVNGLRFNANEPVRAF